MSKAKKALVFNEKIIDDRFSVIGKSWLDDAMVTRPSNIPDIIYHYTSAAGLEGMLKFGKIWLTDFRFLNDATEMIYGTEQGDSIIRDTALVSTDPLIRRLAKEILQYRQIASPFEFYIFSASDQKDDLSQWRGYAQEGKGFTVGICGSTISKLTKLPKAPFGFGPVIYDEKKQIDVLKKAFSEIEEELRVLLRDAPNFENEIFDRAASIMDNIIEGRAAVSKHDSFAAESEWRIVSAVSRGGPDDDVKVRINGLRPIPYVEAALDPTSGRLPIKQIGIGPGFVGSEVTHAVETLLRITGHEKVDVYQANAPYRHF